MSSWWWRLHPGRETNEDSWSGDIFWNKSVLQDESISKKRSHQSPSRYIFLSKASGLKNVCVSICFLWVYLCAQHSGFKQSKKTLQRFKFNLTVENMLPCGSWSHTSVIFLVIDRSNNFCSHYPLPPPWCLTASCKLYRSRKTKQALQYRYIPWAPRNHGKYWFGPPQKNMLFTIKISQYVGVGGPWYIVWIFLGAFFSIAESHFENLSNWISFKCAGGTSNPKDFISVPKNSSNQKYLDSPTRMKTKLVGGSTMLNQPIWAMLYSQIGFQGFGWKLKNRWNHHHLDMLIPQPERKHKIASQLIQSDLCIPWLEVT